MGESKKTVWVGCLYCHKRTVVFLSATYIFPSCSIPFNRSIYTVKHPDWESVQNLPKNLKVIKSNIPGVLLNKKWSTHELDFKTSLYYLFRQCLLVKISLTIQAVHSIPVTLEACWDLERCCLSNQNIKFIWSQQYWYTGEQAGQQRGETWKYGEAT